jgi:deoxycytidine triphosphate deaminase
MARKFFDHMLAGWCDPGFNNSVLTLEFRNMTTYHDHEIRLGDRIGQLVFFECEPVPEHKSYAQMGSYNGQMQTVGGVDK